MLYNSWVMKENVFGKIEGFFHKEKKLSVKKNEIILNATDAITHVFYIQKGYIRMYTVSNEGEEITLHIAKPGSFFPMMSIIASLPNKYRYQAITDVTLYQAATKKVLAFLQKEPEVIFLLTTKFASGICGLLDRIEHLVAYSAYTKVALLLLYFVDRYGKARKDGIVIQLRFTHTMIASWLGLSRETVSRHIEQLEKKHVLSVDDSFILIKNIKKLEKETENKPSFKKEEKEFYI